MTHYVLLEDFEFVRVEIESKAFQTAENYLFLNRFVSDLNFVNRFITVALCLNQK